MQPHLWPLWCGCHVLWDLRQWMLATHLGNPLPESPWLSPWMVWSRNSLFHKHIMSRPSGSMRIWEGWRYLFTQGSSRNSLSKIPLMEFKNMKMSDWVLPAKSPSKPKIIEQAALKDERHASKRSLRIREPTANPASLSTSACINWNSALILHSLFSLFMDFLTWARIVVQSRLCWLTPPVSPSQLILELSS